MKSLKKEKKVPEKVHTLGKKVHKKVHFTGSMINNLTKTEKLILDMLSKEFMTPKDIAQRRKTSIRAVYKIIQKLKKKGVINPAFSTGNVGSQNTDVPFTFSGVTTPLRQQIRLHGQEWNIKLRSVSQIYKMKRQKANTLNVDGNTIRLYERSIEVYINQSFYGKTPQEAAHKSYDYFFRLATRLENQFNLIFMKNYKENIKEVNAHYSETNNELAKDCNEKKEKVRIKAPEDGKTWFTIDNSFNLNEAETVHPETSKQDMAQAVQPFFNDLRENSPPTLTNMMGALDKISTLLEKQAILNQNMIEINKETASGLNAVVKVLNIVADSFKAQMGEPREPTPEGKPDYFG